MKIFDWKLKIVWSVLAIGLCSCATNVGRLSDSDFEDGTYSYSYERVTESVQAESLFLGSDTAYSLWQSNTASGLAVQMNGRNFAEGGFYSDDGKLTELPLSINGDGTISSSANETITGKATKDGRIFWSGMIEQHGQKMLVSEYALLTRVYESSLAPSSLNGKYKVELDKRYGELEFSLENGIAESDVSKFIVDANGEFRSRISTKILQKIGSEYQAGTLVDISSFGKIDENGKVSYKMYSGSSSSIDSPENDSENAGTISFTGEKIISASESTSGKKSAEKSANFTKTNKPAWFTQNVVESKGKLSSCASASAKGKSVAKNMAITTALSKIASHKALSVKSEANSSEGADGRSLLELIDLMSSQKIEYEIECEHADKETKTYFVKIKEK